jgi:hypothetical protein
MSKILSHIYLIAPLRGNASGVGGRPNCNLSSTITALDSDSASPGTELVISIPPWWRISSSGEPS